MSLRAPKNLARIVNPSTGLSMVEAEVMAETAASLGHQGRKVEKALAQLQRAHDRKDQAGEEAATRAAADAVWAYFIQRELCGQRDHRAIIAEMRIPRRVLLRLGQRL